MASSAEQLAQAKALQSPPAPATQGSGNTAALAAALKAQSGGWDYNGVDTSGELARLLEANGITDLSKLRLVTEANPDYRAPEPGAEKYEKAAMGQIPQQRSQLSYEGKNIGWLGDANGDGSLGKVGESQYLYTNPHVLNGSMPYDAGWSSSGKGQTSFQVQPGADGSVQFSPRWDTSSNAEEARMAAMALAMAFGGGALAGGEAAGAGAAGAGSGATNMALIESSLGTAGYGASSAGLGGMGAAGAAGAAAPALNAGSITGGSGLSGAQMAALNTPLQMTAPLTVGEIGAGAAGAGAASAGGGTSAAGGAAPNMAATNPALIESAVGTPGYGASSAGAGGGSGQLASGGGSNVMDQINKWRKLMPQQGGGGGNSDMDRQRRQAELLQQMRDHDMQQQLNQKVPGWTR